MLSIKEAKEIAKGYDVIPLKEEIMADVKTPIQVLHLLKTQSTHCFMLESVEKQERWGRYTFIGFDPVMEITCTDGEVVIRTQETVIVKKANPKEEVQAIMQSYRSPKIKGMPSFTGGLVGYFSYDYVKYAEPNLQLQATDDAGFQDMDLMLFDKVIAYDNVRQKISIIVNVKTDRLEQEYDNAVKEIARIKRLIQEEPIGKIPAGKLLSEVSARFSQQEYCEKVERAKEYIKEGDIFQVVLANRMEAEYEGSLLNAYRVLRTTNPSPYMFYFSSEDLEVAGASPETLVKVEDDTVYTFPLAGTRPRGKDEQEDLQLEQELLADEKE